MSTGSPAALPIGLPPPETEPAMQHQIQLAKGNRLMPSQILYSVFTLIVPTAQWPWWALAIQGAAASLAFTVASMNLILRWLIAGIFFDIATGLLCGIFLAGPFRPSMVARGVMVKGTCLAMVVALSRQPELQFDVAGYTFSVGELLGAWYLVSEWTSTAKNLDDLGMPFPKGIKTLLANVHSSIDNTEIGTKIVNVFKSSSKQTIGDTEIVKNKETVVTTTTPPEKL